MDDFKLLLGTSESRLSPENGERLSNACLVVNALGPKARGRPGRCRPRGALGGRSLGGLRTRPSLPRTCAAAYSCTPPQDCPINHPPPPPPRRATR